MNKIVQTAPNRWAVQDPEGFTLGVITDHFEDYGPNPTRRSIVTDWIKVDLNPEDLASHYKWITGVFGECEGLT
jgi:hypothetical protein